MQGKRIVIKLGSSTLTDASGAIDTARIASIAAQVAHLRSLEFELVIVSSGAIAAGVGVLKLDGRPADMPGLQAAASVGQVVLIDTYARHFADHGIPVGQVLLTRHDTGHRESYLHARDTFERLIGLGVVPIVNENDTVAVDEIRIGDNDTLAALVATLVSADLVVLMSDIEGVYDADPRSTEGAALVSHIEELTDEVLAAAGGAGTANGTGGMVTKIEAARVLRRAGIPMVVCDGSRDDILIEIADGKSAGTLFSASGSRLGAKKLWIATARRARGEITIDAGAVCALVERGKSLLPAGVVAVTGEFDAGDTVVLKGPQGEVIARGVAEMCAADVARVRGLQSAVIAKESSDLSGKVVIHRDNLAIL